jgi:hypothetical protein
METRRTTVAQLRDAYRVPGFAPRRTITAVEGDPFARIVTLTRRAKKRSAGRAAPHIARGMIADRVVSAIFRVATCTSTSRLTSGESTVVAVVA